MSGLLRRVLFAQSAYYLVTAAWPWVHLGSFEAVTGEKVDDWLVRTVGALIGAVALAIGTAAYLRERGVAVVVLAIASAAALGAVETYYAAVGRISPVYFADAAVEAVLIAGLIAGLRKGDA
jgi:hypothetical protein